MTVAVLAGPPLDVTAAVQVPAPDDEDQIL